MNAPTGYTALDLVGFTDKGIYSSSANYVQNDIVHYGGDMWRCLIDDTTNIAPSEGLNWTLWIGEPTNLTEAIIAPLEVSPATDAHSVGDQLIFNDVLYKVISAISIGDSLTVGTNIEAARKIVYQISGIESDIATIEPTSIASKNYAVGEYMFYGWEFYRVTTAITAGDTIVTSGAGQNVTEVTVGGELSALKSHVATEEENRNATMRQNGAHNRLPLNITEIKSINTSGTWSGDTYTLNNVTFKCNTDNNNYITSIRVQSTAATTGATFKLTDAWALNATSYNTGRQYILSGCPAVGSADTYDVYIASNATDTSVAVDIGYGATFTAASADGTYKARIKIGSMAAGFDQTFYPMVRLATDSDTTFRSYVMTNRELTNVVLSQWTLLHDGNPAVDVDGTYTIPSGYRYIVFELAFLYGVISQIILPYGRIISDPHAIIRTLSGYVDGENNLAILHIENTYNAILYTFKKQVGTTSGHFRIWGVK